MSRRVEGVTNDKTEELCNLFTSTLSSVSADTEALKQLICLNLAVGIDVPGTNDGENVDPNVAVHPTLTGKSGSGEEKSEIIERLHQIDSAVTELEKKMHVVQEIVAEEKRSLKELEAVKHAAEVQEKVLKHMVNAFKDLQLPGPQFPAASNRNNLNLGSLAAQESSSRDMRARGSRNGHGQIQEICIPRITDFELKSVSRNTRGRITLITLNDAVADIEKVCRNKYEVLHSRDSGGKRLYSGRAKQMERQYRQELITHRELQVEEHGDRPWVSEQDLRQSCAFFRSGESTARAILAILRTLRRLKQVPGKKTCEVTYILV